MSHPRYIVTLLRSRGPHGGASLPNPEERREAEEHLGRCSDCWAVVSLMHQLAMGEPPAGDDRMAALFGCVAVQEELYLLAGLTAGDIWSRHPDVARHLGWCHACRDRFAELLIVEHAAARGEFGPPLVAPSPPRWTEAAVRTGERMRELVGRVVVEVRRAAAAFTAAPEGLFLLPVSATGGALRGTPHDARHGSVAARLRVPLGESGIEAELTLEPEGAGRVGLAVRLLPGDEAGFSVQLREGSDESAALVAQHTARGGQPAVVQSLGAGHYALDIRTPEAGRYRVHVDVESAM